MLPPRTPNLTQDILVIASAAFARTVVLLALDKDDYLTETYICACKNPGRERLLVAKAGKKYFAVLRSGCRERIAQMREVLGQVRNVRDSCWTQCSTRITIIEFTIPTTTKCW